MAASTPLGGASQSWRRWLTSAEVGKRLKSVARLHLRQLPCLHTVLPTVRCWKRKKYQTLGQDEEGDGAEVEDRRQGINLTFGRVMVKVAMLAMVGLTVLFVVKNGTFQGETPDASLPKEERLAMEFKRDSPVVLYLAAVELLVCGACAHTAGLMYRRRRHAQRHPADSEGKERLGYIKVELEKDAGLEHRQLFGLGFRPSTDGLECLLVEAVRSGSVLDQWNQRALGPSTEELMEEALGDAGDEGSGQAPPGVSCQTPRQQVGPGAAIVAVNDAAADVGMMQLQLTKSKVTLWIHGEFAHPSQLEADMLGAAPPQQQQQQQQQDQLPQQHSASSKADGGDVDAGAAVADGQGQPVQPPAAPVPTFLGRPDADSWGSPAAASMVAPTGPRCACMSLEDEEQQILTRWTVCAIIFGWVTVLPVLLMQPHEHRPRQQLFRQYLLKPCLLMMPIAMVLWIVDCIQVLAEHQLIAPFYYFGICHMVIPAVLVFYLLQMQAADERLVLEQRKSRLKEAQSAVPVVAEDPAPTLLKELIAINPAALVWLGACASIPLVAFSLLTPMQTARGKKAQGYVNTIYAPCSVLQIAFVWLIHKVHFVDLPRLYLASISLLLSLPCFVIWCFCLICASRYGREDVRLVARQRRERAVSAASASTNGRATTSIEGEQASAGLVECTESNYQQWELIFTA